MWYNPSPEEIQEIQKHDNYIDTDPFYNFHSTNRRYQKYPELIAQHIKREREAEYAEYVRWDMSQEQLWELSDTCTKGEGLDALSTKDIDFLFEGVVQYKKAKRDPQAFIDAHFDKPEWRVG